MSFLPDFDKEKIYDSKLTEYLYKIYIEDIQYLFANKDDVLKKIKQKVEMFLLEHGLNFLTNFKYDEDDKLCIELHRT